MPNPAEPGDVAREAFLRGDLLLQLAFPLVQQQGIIVPMVGGSTSSSRQDVNVDLNRVASEGWALTAASVVFVQTGEESRDKFMMSGQNVAVSGEVIGYYLFSRDASAQSETAARRTARQSAPPAPVRTRRNPGEIAPLTPLSD